MGDMRIYVACLASYNNGVLHGAWIDCEGKDSDEIAEEVQRKVLLTSRFPNTLAEHPNTGEQVPSAEEWAIHDHEGFGKLVGEYTSFDTIADIVEVLEDDSDGHKLIALRYLVEHGGYASDIGAAIQQVDEVGVYDQTLEAWAEERFNDLHEGGVDGLPDMIRYHIDWRDVGRDAETSGIISQFEGYLIEDRS